MLSGGGLYDLRVSEGLAVAGKRVANTNGRWGFIDESGKYVIEAKFVGETFFRGTGRRRVQGFIDRHGNGVIQRII